MVGQYELKSPYHKNKMLPFNVMYKNYDDTFEVYTEEYKGWTCSPVNTQYTEESIKSLINKGIIKLKEV